MQGTKKQKTSNDKPSNTSEEIDQKENSLSEDEQVKENENSKQNEEKEQSGAHIHLTYIETLEKRNAEIQDQLREYIQAYKKIKEDHEAFKFRLERESKKELETMRGKVVTELFDVLDNLDRSILGGESGWNADSILQGLRMVQTQFLDKLQTLGLTTIEPLNQNFNPNESEAISMVQAEEESMDDKIVLVYSRGYKMGDRVIRPAKVQVAKWG